MDLKEYRQEMDAIDNELVALFVKRMEVAAGIADYKKENNLPILAPAREREKLQDVAKKAGPEMAGYTKVLYSMLFELSRSYQGKRSGKVTPLYRKITDAIENTPKLFPQSPMVACQGVEGAFSQLACEKMFKDPFIMYFKSFEAVFGAIEQGLCQYGILPIENSTAGSVKKVYDLMIQRNFSIVRTFRLKVDHNLLANPGAKLSDIKEIYSHEQAISQCGDFLATLEGVNVIPVANTAIASEMVASSGRKDVAALSSRSCAELYGLECLNDRIQDSDNNYTRFICVTKDPAIYAGANRISLVIAFENRPGALYDILSKLAALDINLTKLESCPVAGSDFEFIFFLELEASVHEPGVLPMLEELERSCANFQFLGSYAEV